MTSNRSARRGPAGRRRVGAAAALAAAATLLAAGCTGPAAAPPGGGGATPPGAATGELRVAVISHGTPGDSFWDVVKNGAEAAGRQLGVKVDYNAAADPASQARLVDNAVAQKAGGIVVSMANPDALRDSVRRAVDAGIPVVTINSGEERSQEFGAITHVGQSEGVAGERAGETLRRAGRTNVLCVIHEAGNAGLNQRCEGARKAFGSVRDLQVDISNPTDVQSRIKGALGTDGSIDAVLTLNPQVAANAVSAVRDAGSSAAVATFDLNADVINAIREGRLLFALDQQQYLQGYLPVTFLKLYRDNANTVGGGRPVLTGPGVVDKSNVDTVGSYAGRGTR
ncbi:simple sugar transport system substrate-binding protein [Streptoalloteichus tenebrarius]|uniref:Simple sugar transport system substrate-binding protein n=1 Tax=Streptoalloteichus tenebrarius (strain ATCC 17920 / DSM 40477 / JCM 4838 / CBS 697.72 / NBRC 16177 / NCIMB 11028 / NRRL B-12390 / A12253. 1 / ISP 5477) TaxID=1933 RepID=A0ABT1HV09_STRSD|nr:sugar ABC transporter substrate-binding protein [Streptoalloteichus tenebrarius]MCP2259360.1 simple sugar transport system substrate-binding protein [Streptoalloteichus tenebrarius]BFF02300.1 sugar ABC transporter substrate-binding protein [Streptoalloteichus tenebrarius]